MLPNRFVLLLCVATMVCLLACNRRSTRGQDSGTSSTSSSGGSSSSPDGTAPPPPAADPLPPEVRFVDLHFEKKSPTEYWVSLTAHNDGPGIAHVDGGCHWTCPVSPQTLSGNAWLISGGVIAPGRQFPYSAPASGMCVPPLLSPLECSFEVKGMVFDQGVGRVGSQVKNVRWSQTVQIPM
jgi:hypothetical protein